MVDKMRDFVKEIIFLWRRGRHKRDVLANATREDKQKSKWMQ